MYKRKYIILSFVIVFTFTVLMVIKPDNKKTAPDIEFPSPEEAIEQQLLSTNYELIESNGVYFAVCNTAVNNYACQYIVNNGKGWQVVTEYMFRNAYYDKQDENGLYEIYIREYMDKYFIYISQTKTSIDNNGKIEVKDSLGSSFSEMDFYSIQDEHYWFVCIDDIPDDYTVSINGVAAFSE